MGPLSDAIDPNSWPLLFSLVINGSMTTTAAELGGSGVCNDAQLVFNQQVGGTCSGLMQGLGTLVKTGPGALELTGANTYSGGTIIEQGLLSVNNTEGSGTGFGNVLVQPAGILGGSGTISGDVINQGTIAPGNSIGTLTINGNYIQTAGSTYAAEIDDQGHSDLIHATGIAALTGGTVTVAAQSGTYSAGMTYQILRADGGVSGTFDRVVTNLPTFHGALVYDSDDVFLLLLRYADLARTRNQFAVATYLDAIQPSATGDLSVVLAALDTQTGDQARAAFNQLAGEPYADLAAIDVAGANLFTDTAFYRMWNIDDFDDNCTKGRNLWAYGIGNWQRQQSTSSNAGWDAYSGYDNQTAGFMIGYDKQFDNVLLGFGSGYGRSDTTFLCLAGQRPDGSVQLQRLWKGRFRTALCRRRGRIHPRLERRHSRHPVRRALRRAGQRHRLAATFSVRCCKPVTTSTWAISGSRRWPACGMCLVRWAALRKQEPTASTSRLPDTGAIRCPANSAANWPFFSPGAGEQKSMANGSMNTPTWTAAWRWPSRAARPRAISCGASHVDATAHEPDWWRSARINDHASVHLNYDALLQSSYASQQLTGGLSLGF